jgi:predicted PurR-regulated permease PerM
MKIDWKSKEARIALTVFATVAALIVFWRVIEDIDDLLGAVGALLRQTGTVLLPFLLGALISYILLPVVRYIDRTVFARFIKRDGRRRGISVLTVYAILIALLAALLSYLLPLLFSNVQEFAANLSTYLDKGRRLLETLLDENALLSQPAVRGFVEDAIGNLGNVLRESTAQIAQAAVSTVMTVSGVVTDSFIAFMTSIYLLIDNDRLKRSAKRLVRSLFKPARAERIFLLTNDFDRIFGQYVRARLLESLMVFVAMLVGFTVYPVPYAVLFALIGAITNLVPFFGPIVGFLIVVPLVLVIRPERALYAAVFITCLQQIDGYVVGPKVMGDGVNLRPIWILMAVSAGGAFCGVPGMVLGVPVAAFVGVQLSRFTASRVGEKPPEPEKPARRRARRGRPKGEA